MSELKTKKCWECGGAMDPRLRPDWRPWWYCERCDRLTPVASVGEYLHEWMPVVRFDEDVVIHRFPSEPAVERNGGQLQ